MQFRLVDADPQGADALALLRAAALEARALYPELFSPASPWPTNGPTPERGVYLLAYAGGQAVGMGAHRPLSATDTELRRLYVAPQGRRQGVAKALLNRIEDHARAQGFARLLLETGNRQLPALALYAACGFRRIAPFGEYLNEPSSVCFEKSLALRPGACPC